MGSEMCIRDRWHTVEQELYTSVFYMIKAEALWISIHFTLCTDHKNLTYINESPAHKVLRWKLSVHHLDFDIVHIPGRYNKVADDLSRLVEDTVNHALFPQPKTSRVRSGHSARLNDCLKIFSKRFFNATMRL